MSAWPPGKTPPSTQSVKVPEKRPGPPLSLLVVTALKDEAVTFCRGAGKAFFPVGLSQACVAFSKNFPEQEKKVPVVYTGPGHAGISALDRFLSGGRFRTILFCGFAGGLSPSLVSGDIVLGSRLLVPGRSPEPLGLPEFLISRYRTGSIVPVDRMISSPKDKELLYSETGGDLVDMESAGWFESAKSHDMTAWFVRIVSDAFNESLPPALLQCIDEKGENSIRGMLSALMEGPFFWVPLLSLQRGLRAAHAALSELGQTVAVTIDRPGSLEERS